MAITHLHKICMLKQLFLKKQPTEVPEIWAAGQYTQFKHVSKVLSEVYKWIIQICYPRTEIRTEEKWSQKIPPPHTHKEQKFR